MDPTYKRKRLDDVHGVECVLKSEPMKYACRLTMDPNTANPNLKLSEENRKVTWVDEQQAYEYHADRFDHVPQVLCREALFGSRFYWEVECHGGNAVIGVAYHGIGRKTDGWDSKMGYNNMSWSLYCSDNGYYFYDAGIPQRSIAGFVFHRIGVYLDWPAGTLSFFNVSAGELTHIHTYYAKFTEPVYPGFRIYKNSSFSLYNHNVITL